MNSMNKFFYIIFCIPFYLNGQDSLSLGEAIQIGLQKNYDIQLTAKNIEINTLFNSWGEAGRMPQVNILETTAASYSNRIYSCECFSLTHDGDVFIFFD